MAPIKYSEPFGPAEKQVRNAILRSCDDEVEDHRVQATFQRDYRDKQAYPADSRTTLTVLYNDYDSSIGNELCGSAFQ